MHAGADETHLGVDAGLVDPRLQILHLVQDGQLGSPALLLYPRARVLRDGGVVRVPRYLAVPLVALKLYVCNGECYSSQQSS